MRAVLVAVLGAALAAVTPADAQAALTGVNLAGAEFGTAVPGTYNTDYTYPTSAEVSHFVGLGMNVFRVPFRWERLQRSLNGPFDASEAARLDAFVSTATGAGATVVLDPHNYARYNGAVVGSTALPNAAFADFWSRLATRYGSNARVAFGLMNEPHTMPTEQWLGAANAAIAAIRQAGATNLILVPGNGYTGAHSWYSTFYGSSNASVMGGIVDAGNNLAYDLHQYLDGDSSGQSATCTSATVGSQRLAAVTAWLRQNGRRGFLGEFGAAANPTCLAALDDLLDYVDANTDVWLGWTYWAAGPWWGTYMYSIEPTAQGADRPQTAALAPHFARPVAIDPGPSDVTDVSVTVVPNPARGRAGLVVRLAESADVTVEIVDALGRVVRRIDVERQPAGASSLALDVSGLAPGTYAVRLRAGATVQTRPLVVVR